jgi:hypothetical protein
MLWSKLMKKPVLVMGILMVMALFLDLSRRKDGKSLFFREDFVPHSCKAVLVKLEKRIPANWDAECEQNNLAIEMNYSSPASGSENMKQVAYRRLANDLTFIAKNSPQETLERVFIVRIRATQPGFEINAVSEGKFVSKMATLNSPEYIREHLKNTVQVKETLR